MNLKHLLLSFEGRIGRQSYWTGALVLFGIAVVAAVIGAVLGEAGQALGNLVSLALLYPGLALAAKRWHDRNKSGWWSLIALIPLIGPIWALVENGFLRGMPGPNRFGPAPGSPLVIEHDGRTYHHHADGGFTHSSGAPVGDAALLGTLGATALALRAEAASTGEGGWGGDGGSSGGD